MLKNGYDLVIIGGGPAGMAAGLYAGRYKMSTIMFTDSYGGTISSAHKVCNYPGIMEISGMDLIAKMSEQIKNIGVTLNYDKVVNVKKENDLFIVSTPQQTIKAKKVILGLGKKKRKLSIEREDELVGKGVHYCTTCDGAFYKNKITAVIGGSDAAVTAALLLGDIATKVYLIYRKDKLRAEPMWVEALENQKNIEVLYNSEVKKLIGVDRLEQIELNTGQKIDLNGLFIEIGAVANTELLNKLNIALDSREEIIVDKEQKTNISGIFAAGDATNVSDLKQVVTAVSQGAVAAYHAFIDLKSNI